MRLADLQEARYAFHPILDWINQTIKDHQDDVDWFAEYRIKNPMRDGNLFGIYQLLMHTFGASTFNEHISPDKLKKWGSMTNYIDWTIPNQDRLVVGLSIDGLNRTANLIVSTMGPL